MKKLAVLLVTIAMATFMAEMALADDHGWREDWWGIQGTYEMVATGTCLHDKGGTIDGTFGGFTFSGTGTLLDPYTATPRSADHFISAYMGEGTWTFDGLGPDGLKHGTMWVMQNCILPDYPGSTAKVTQALMPSAPVPPGILEDGNKVKFTYVVAGSTITVTIGAPVGLTLVGKISSDHKTMTLQSAMPVPPQGVQFNGVIGYYQICTINRTLFRVNE